MQSWKIAAQAALIGAIASLAFGAIQGLPFLRLRIVGEVDIDGRPSPGDFVRIEEGTPYVVPDGKLLVLTSVGGGGEARVRIDGTVEVRAHGELPFGLVARSVEVVDVSGNVDTLPRVVRGYLENE